MNHHRHALVHELEELTTGFVDRIESLKHRAHGATYPSWLARAGMLVKEHPFAAIAAVGVVAAIGVVAVRAMRR